MARKLNLEKYKDYPEASKSIRNYVIASIMFKNRGKFNIIPALDDGVILDGDIACEDVKLPKDCRIEINITSEYGDRTVGSIIRKDQYIAAFWGRLKRYMNISEASDVLKKIEVLNNCHFDVVKKNKRFIINTDLFLSDIKFPEGFSYVIVYNPSEKDNSYQCQIIKDRNIVFPGVLNCKAKENDKVIFPGVLVDTEKSNENDKKNVL